jgi:hypothetical protein
MLRRVVRWVVTIGVVGMVAGLTVGCTLPGMPEAQPGRRMLWQSELERLFQTDRTVEFVSPEGSAVVTYSRAGDQGIEWANGKDTGTFQIRNDHFCSRWKTLRNGAESCTRVFKISETEYELVGDDGVYAATMNLK